MKIFFHSIILVFLFSTNILSQCQEKILAFDGQLADFFGISVSIFENKVAIEQLGMMIMATVQDLYMFMKE